MIRGQTRPLPVAAGTIETPREIKAKFNASIHNRFDIEVVDAKTGEIKQRAQAENIILNQLWTYAFSNTANQRKWNAYIHFGSGNTPPAASDTALTAFVGAKAVSDETYLLSESVFSVREKITISASEHAGASMSEVGVGFGASAGTLCTKSLIKDMNGNPISIIKTDADIINIYATTYAHWNASYSNGSVRIGVSENSSLLKWMVGKTTAPSFFSKVSSDLIMTNSVSIYTTALTYDVTTKSLTFPAKRIQASEGNFAGGIMYATGEVFFRLPGVAVSGVPIGTGDGVAVDFRSPFGWSANPTVKINGTETTAVTVDLKKPFLTTANCYFENITEKGAFVGSGTPVSIGDDVLFVQAQKTCIFYNPNFLFGIAQYAVSVGSPVVCASNDLATWTEMSPSIGAEFKKYKYWKITSSQSSQTRIKFISDVSDNADIHFTSPPPLGAVITADGNTDTVAKDANHVYDITATVFLGEYTPPVV